MDTEHLILIGKIVGAMSAIAAFAGVLYTLCLKTKDGYLKVKKHIDNACYAMQLVNRELGSNGGSSIKDSIKRIETKISVNDGKYRAAMCLHDEPIWECDKNGNCIWVNHSYSKLTGIDSDYLKNKGWFNIVAESDRSRVRDEWVASIEEERIFTCEYMIKTHEGELIKVRADSYPIVTDLNSSVVGYIGMLSIS